MAPGIGIVQTKYGLAAGLPLEGKYEGITEFRGIPYAAPPVGDLRWRPPVAPASWDGVRACDTYGRAAIQNFSKMEPNIQDFYYRGHPEMSEDCLYLNVTTGAGACASCADAGSTATAGDKRPVYIWFHGDPNCPGLPDWPKSDADYGWMSLGDTLEGHTGIDGKLEELVHEFLLRRADLPRA